MHARERKAYAIKIAKEAKQDEVERAEQLKVEAA